MSKNKKAIVVGSGIAGIASAIRLVVKGYDVEVFEKNSYLGGKLTEIRLGEYRFDAGPSLFTMPQFVEELFEQADRKSTDYFDYKRSDIACHYFFEDGTFLPFPADKKKLLHEVENRLKIDVNPLSEHIEHVEYIYRKTHKTFLEQSLHQFGNYFSKDILESILAIPKLGLFSTMNEVNEKRLNHPKLIQIFNRYATYNGSNPYHAPGILNVIPHLEHGFGTFFPKKGMNDIPQSLIRLGKDLGIKFHLNQPVDEIVVEAKKVKGIQSKGDFFPANVVFCNSDIRPAYKYLLPTEKIPKKVQKQEPSSSAMIFYWGIKKKFDQLDLHNIFFAEDYKKEFDCIFKDNSVDSDSTIYIHVSSKMKPDDAPETGENWFVMVNVPSNSGQDWEILRKKIRANVLLKLSRLLKTDIEPLIEVEDYLDPIRIEERSSSFAGSLYGASSNDRMAAFFRHPNFSNVKGLHFVGGSVHPGGGIPLCLLSAKIAVSTIKE
ncbi:phytoene desaturase family protein [Crocinitomicaceae bacterium]|nr:phytoene desaturase family protein [Crocinitomicaceae bacterium]